MDNEQIGDVGLLPAIAIGTLFVFYVVWAAMHDIAHGESDTTLEYAALIASLPAFAFLYRMALSHLTPNSKVIWLGGTGLLILVFGLGAVDAKVHPKYAPDPTLASLFLTAGIPLLGLIGYHLIREVFCRLNRRGS